jgi:hypothetical protein
VTPLEQLTDAVRASASHLFEPRAAYRFRSTSRPNLAPVGEAQGKNPPYGAAINYWLKDPVKTGEEKKKDSPDERDPAPLPKAVPVEITILDPSGQKIRTIKGTNKAGVNRAYWDLAYEPTSDVRIRTTPPGNPHVWEEKRFRGKDSRGVFYYGIDVPKKGPLVAPGTYTVKLAVAGKEETQKLVVLKDPNSGVGDAEVQASAKFSWTIYRDISAAARMINELEWTRRQLEDFRRMLTAGKADKAVFAQAGDLEKAARAVEDKLLQPTLAEGDIKSFRGPLELYLKLIWLQAESGVSGSDVSGNADFPPTEAEREVYDLLSGQLAESRREFDELYARTVPAFNEAMKAKGYVQIMTVKEPEEPRPDEKERDPDEDADR